jgi:hypothetical protein
LSDVAYTSPWYVFMKIRRKLSLESEFMSARHNRSHN